MEFFESLRNSFDELVGDKITLGTNSVTTLNIIVWSLFIGFVIAIGVCIYNKLVLGSVVGGIIKREAFSEGTALTISELGCANPLVKFALRKNSSFRRIVRMAGDTDAECAAESFDCAKFYIPEDRVHRAEVIYGRNGMTVGTVLLSIAAFFALALLAFWVIPNLLTMLSNFIEGITPKSNIL